MEIQYFTIFKKTERLYMERRKKWAKHGSFDKELTTQLVKRVTFWILFMPIFYYETIIKTDL
jgi:hypothetical protein